MSSPSSAVSYGWEEVSVSEWDEETSVSDSLISDSSSDSEYKVRAKAVGPSSTAVKQEEETEENSDIFEMAKKTMDKPQNLRSSKAHELSESEDSSSELHTLSVPSKKSANSSISLNETANSNILSSPNRDVAHELSESEDSSNELHSLSVLIKKSPNSSISLNETTNSNILSSSNRSVANMVSSNESSESDCNSNEADNNNSKVAVDIREKIDLVRQNNKVLNSEDHIPVKLGGELSIENIGDEEIWMLQCPLDLDPKKLIDKEIDFSGISEFAVEAENTEKVYTATACTGRWKTLSCILPSAERKQLEAVVVNAAGQIIITEKIMSSPPNSPVPDRSNKMEFPGSLKVRHPLFGADYEKELDIRRQRLLVSSLKKKKKKKKKERKEMQKDISYGTISEDQPDDCIPSLLEDMEPQMEPVISKKSKKRRYSESFNVDSDHSEDNPEKLKAKHLKKKLRKSVSSNSIDESMEIDSHVNQEYSKKKKKKKKNHDVQ